MNASSRALRLFIAAMALPLLAAPLSASRAADRHAKSRVTVSKPVVADNGIIALPLNPIVPAARRLCAERTSSGLGYTMLRPASGSRPAGDDFVLISYIGYLASTGEVFDQGTESPLKVGEVIPGFSEGLKMMARTGVARLCVPAALGYGAEAPEPIPANADLVFQVELLDFKTSAEVEQMRKAQAAEAAAPKDQ